MRNGWPNSSPDKPAGVEGLDSNTLGNVWQLYLNSDYGIGEARFSVPVNRPKEKQFRVRLALPAGPGSSPASICHGSCRNGWRGNS